MNDRQKKYLPIYKLFIPFYPFSIEDLDGEIWRPIPAYEKYHCSNFGRIKRFYKHSEPRILTPALGGGGYLSVSLCKGGKHKHFSIHRLVAELFIPNPENKPEVNHVRGCFNNYVEWLEWATSSENCKHAHDTGLVKNAQGADDSQAKLSSAQVKEIRDNPQGLTGRQLAEKFGISPMTISEIQRGKR